MPETYVQVVFPLPLNQAFTYSVPDELKEIAKIGSRVIAPFGPRRLTGFIVGLSETTELSEIKPVQDILDLTPLVSDHMLALAQWIAEYYLCSLGEVLKATLPSVLMRSSRKVVESITSEAEFEAERIASGAPRQAQVLRYLSKCRRISVNELKRRIGATCLHSSLIRLESRGLIQVQHFIPGAKVKPKIEKYVRIQVDSDELTDNITSLQKKAPKQASCLRYLKIKKNDVPQREILKQTASSLPTLKALARAGLIEIRSRQVFRDYYSADEWGEPKKITLNAEQKQALATITTAIKNECFTSFLLYGVTGSGKTQVYIDAIYQALAKGKTAIVLVPEISLTPQTVRRFRSHFRDKVAVLHSAMTSAERLDSWRRLKEGQASVAIGPRSAVFAPLENLGLIVVDEEHEASYKQDITPRYHARDVAVVRARSANAVVILGSATPSAESFYNAKMGKYKLLQLTQRVNQAPLPRVQILDMRKERRLSGQKEPPVFSRLLAQKIEEKLASAEQIILLLNRRGFSSYLRCQDCGYIEECENCQISLTYHLQGRRLRCHYCGFTKNAPEKCPECDGTDILFRGLGTQKVEEELKKRFSTARVVRMDLDTTSRKYSHDRILQDFGKGKYDILLGTQMVAKGLDFEKVTLVGAINADISLLIPDFRSSERTFQLLTQVAGRAGRSELLGEVIIQSYFPENFCLQCALTHNYDRFFAGEILERGELGYPPFGRIVCIHFSGEDEKKVQQAAFDFSKTLKTRRGIYQVLGPAVSPIAKIKKKYRWQILIKGDKSRDGSGKILRQDIERAREHSKGAGKNRSVRIAVDVDPVSII
ncbi:MAG: primosomal protein N' [bacterium]